MSPELPADSPWGPVFRAGQFLSATHLEPLGHLPLGEGPCMDSPPPTFSCFWCW